MSKHESQTGSITDDGAPDGGVVVDNRDRDVRNNRVARGGGSVTPSETEKISAEPMPTAHEKNPGHRVGRRTFVKGLGAAAAASVVVGHPNGLVQESEAAVPLVVAGVIGTSIALDWGLREMGIRGSESPPEGLTQGALAQDVYETTRTRESVNSSTILDNGTILDGIRHTAYTDAKIAAIEELNAGSSETEVLNAALDSANEYLTTVEKNLLKSWNESVSELSKLWTAIQDHPDMATGDPNSYWSHEVMPLGIVYENTSTGSGEMYSGLDSEFSTPSTDVTLADGSTFSVKKVDAKRRRGTTAGNWSPMSASDSDGIFYPMIICDPEITGGDSWSGPSESGVVYLDHEEWGPIWSETQTVVTDVNDGISTWVNSVYGEVQSGSIEISDLVTPRERAAMMAGEEGTSQAIADLIALNIPVDLEREATVFIPETGTTLRGTFGLTDESDGPLESGTTYDPSTFSGDAYFTTDVSLLEGTWEGYESGVDGGTITFSSEPYESMVYSVETTAGETVSVPSSDFTDNEDGTYSYDASESLETPITEISVVNYYAETEETTFETIELDSEFTIEKFENTETGEEAASASFTSSEPQDDSNYITQEEWDDLEKKNQELIDKYEESQDSGAGWGGIPWGDFTGAGGAGALALGVGVAIAVVAGLKQVISFYVPGK